MKFSQFLEKKFLEWQSLVGERKTVREFASYIGVSQATISTWWNTDRVPEGENVLKLATKLGVEVFDVLGLPRPDTDLLFIQTVWGELDEKTRQKLRDLAEDAKQRNLNAEQPASRKRKSQTAN